MAKQMAFYLDQDRCVGCNSCAVACKVKNELEVGISYRKVESYEIQIGDKFIGKFLTHACFHCEHPKCMEVCPTAAYTKTADGIVIHDEAACVGCGYCIYGCPYQAPVMNPATKKIQKCDMCIDLLKDGEQPACVRACPLQVLHVADLQTIKNESKDAVGMPWFDELNPSVRFVTRK